jgi:hypothetical protein
MVIKTTFCHAGRFTNGLHGDVVESVFPDQASCRCQDALFRSLRLLLPLGRQFIRTGHLHVLAFMVFYAGKYELGVFILEVAGFLGEIFNILEPL